MHSVGVLLSWHTCILILIFVQFNFRHFNKENKRLKNSNYKTNHDTPLQRQQSVGSEASCGLDMASCLMKPFLSLFIHFLPTVFLLLSFSPTYTLQPPRK